MTRSKFLVLCLFFSFNIYGQETEEDKKEKFQNWQLRISPYFWFIDVNGAFENPPNFLNNPIEGPHEIDNSFNVLSNSLVSAIAVNVDYTKNRWIGIAHFASWTLDGEDITPDEFVQLDVFYRWTRGFGQANLGYNFLLKEKLKLDGIVGGRLIYSRLRATVIAGSTNGKNLGGDRENLTLEPIIAARLAYIPHYRFEFMAYFDYNILTPNKEIDYIAYIDAMYLINKWLFVSLGYKYWRYIDNTEDAIFNGQFYGFIFRVGAQI